MCSCTFDDTDDDGKPEVRTDGGTTAKVRYSDDEGGDHWAGYYSADIHIGDELVCDIHVSPEHVDEDSAEEWAREAAEYVSRKYDIARESVKVEGFDGDGENCELCGKTTPFVRVTPDSHPEPDSLACSDCWEGT